MKEIENPIHGKAHILQHTLFLLFLHYLKLPSVSVVIYLYRDKCRYIEWAWMTWGRRDKCSVSCRSYQLKPGSMYDWSNYWARGIQFRTAVRWALIINALLIIFL
jgi:hypothetical protein